MQAVCACVHPAGKSMGERNKMEPEYSGNRNMSRGVILFCLMLAAKAKTPVLMNMRVAGWSVVEQIPEEKQIAITAGTATAISQVETSHEPAMQGLCRLLRVVYSSTRVSNKPLSFSIFALLPIIFRWLRASISANAGAKLRRSSRPVAVISASRRCLYSRSMPFR